MSTSQPSPSGRGELLAPAAAIRARRHVVTRASLAIDQHTFDDVTLAGWACGPPLGSAPVTVVVGGITASPFPLGDGRPVSTGGAPAWWPALFAPDLIDITRTTVVSPCWPGHGSTWQHFGERPAPLSVHGLADLVAAWLEGIGCHSATTFVGASLGGLVGLSFAARHPNRCARLITISAGLRPDGWATAVRHVQRELVRDGLASGDVATGMIRARQLGMLTYRGRREFETRFGDFTAGDTRPPVAGYLDHHGRRFADHFPADTFLCLSEAIDRGSFGPTAASRRGLLATITADTVVVGVPGDLLFPFTLQEELHEELRAAGVAASLHPLESIYGHDAFLADQERLAGVLREAGAFGAIPATRSLRPRVGLGRRAAR